MGNFYLCEVDGVRKDGPLGARYMAEVVASQRRFG
jgi:hypothetical protein